MLNDICAVMQEDDFYAYISTILVELNSHWRKVDLQGDAYRAIGVLKGHQQDRISKLETQKNHNHLIQINTTIFY
jgi:hypothetical protein